MTIDHFSPQVRRFSAAFLTFVFIGLCPLVQLPAPHVRVASAGVRPSGVTGRQRADLVVIAPHPDDEALIASGLMLRARQAGEHVAVIVMTNGDFDCQADGLVRERESISGLAELGVDEEHVYFLGYPDGHLARLGTTPLAPVPRRLNGQCTPGNHTYGDRGHGHSDFHHSHFGTHALYTADQVVTDLSVLLEQLRPARIAVTHPNDTHPDHAATHTLLRRALSRLPNAPQILRAVVHNGDCWPTGINTHGQCAAGRVAPDEAVPALTGMLSGYLPDAHIPVPDSCLSPSFKDNPKLRAISAHHSQTHDDTDSYLFAFARKEEVFYSETLVREAGKPYGRLSAVGASKPFTPQLLLHTQLPERASSLPQSVSETPHAFRVGPNEYSLTVSLDTPEITVGRDTGAGRQVLQRWPLPDDTFAHNGRAEFELKLEYISADGSAELGVYAANVLVGITTVIDSSFASFAGPE